MTREQVIAILSSTNCGQIRLRFNSITGTPVHIGPESFRRVADAIRSNRIRLTDAEITDNRYAEAQYNHESNIMQVPASLQRRGTAFAVTSVVHEAVHASFDLTRSVIPVVDNELAAFMAESIFVVHANFPFYANLNVGVQSVFTRYAPAVAATGFLDDATAASLRRLIENRPCYIKDVFEAKMRYRIEALSG